MIDCSKQSLRKLGFHASGALCCAVAETKVIELMLGNVIEGASNNMAALYTFKE